jgi:hypothetical protein
MSHTVPMTRDIDTPKDNANDRPTIQDRQLHVPKRGPTGKPRSSQKQRSWTVLIQRRRAVDLVVHPLWMVQH